MRPGEMGRVALIGPRKGTRTAPGFIPAGWEVAYVEDPSSDCTLAGFTLLCFMPGVSRNRAGEDLRERIIGRAEEAGIPVVVMADPRRPETVVGLSGGTRGAEVFIQRVDRYPSTIERILREIALRPVLGHVQQRIRSAGTLPAPLSLGLRKLVGQVPFAVPDAVEAAARDHVVFKRRVEDLIPLAGCSRSYLYAMAREGGVPLAKAVRRNVVLHGMVLWESEERASDVATRLGYGGAWGWRMAVRRDLDETVLEAVKKPLGQFADRLLATIGVRAS